MVSLGCQFSSLFFQAISLSLRGDGGLEVLEKGQNCMPAYLGPLCCTPTACASMLLSAPVFQILLLKSFYFGLSCLGIWRRPLCTEFPFLLCNTHYCFPAGYPVFSTEKHPSFNLISLLFPLVSYGEV